MPVKPSNFPSVRPATLRAALALQVALVLLAGCDTRLVNVTGIIRSPDLGLTALATSVGTLNPVFASGTTAYQVVVDNNVANVTVTAAAAESGASVTVNGFALARGEASEPIGLEVGANTITIIVTGADGITARTYTIKVTRQFI